uniref:secondary thiamine-phosphate synthase enzyme YjbQ n=1 Tax=Pararhizobium sp. IMCC3301 TaxID=3067904 RepID=UPI0027404281|nr:secondary thiamine-phosphate synthase enzyme YjbQ [Pararhizobium sp. IMCC3301]
MTQTILILPTDGPGLYEFTAAAEAFVREAGVASGLLTLFCQHTSCSLTVQENADPDVQVDLQNFFARLVPDGDAASMRWMIHTAEGPDDMPAHIKTALTQTHLSVPVMKSRLALGTWQGIYLFEHRTRPHQRRVVLHLS